MHSRNQSATLKSYLPVLFSFFMSMVALGYQGFAFAGHYPERLAFKVKLTEWVQSREQYSAQRFSLLSVAARNRLYQLYSSVLLNDVVSDHLYELLEGKAEYISEELVENIVKSGLNYVSESDSERYLHILREYLVSAHFSECQRLVNNNFLLSPVYIGGFGEAMLREYSALIRRAVLAEVTRNNGDNNAVVSSSYRREYFVKQLRYSEFGLEKAGVTVPANDSCQTVRLLIDRSMDDRQGNRVRTLRGYARELRQNI